MSREIKIRFANEKDINSILKIYAPYITNTTLTFEYVVPSIEEFTQRVKNIKKFFPYIVCEINGEIVGYAYASKFREREAYDWSVETSVYLNSKYQGRKIGKALYSCLVEILKLQGFCNAYAVVTVPNIVSDKLHESLNFTTAGIMHKVGSKFGKWLDVKYYELTINGHVDFPKKPLSINEVINSDEIEKILDEAVEVIGEPSL